MRKGLYRRLYISSFQLRLNFIRQSVTIVIFFALSILGIDFCHAQQTHVFIDAEGTKDRILEFEAKTGLSTVSMGDSINAPPGQQVHFAIKDGRASRHISGDYPGWAGYHAHQQIDVQ
jgi:hypothetical protein